MKRSEVRAFLKAGVDELVPAIEFGSGRLSEFNPVASNGSFPRVWQLVTPMSSDQIPGLAPLDSWSIELLIAQKDEMGSSAEEYEHLIDDADELAQKLVYQYRNIVSGYKGVTLEGFTREPFVKKNGAACMSGVQLNFTIVVQDKTNVC